MARKQTNAPRLETWVVAAILALLGLLGHFGELGELAQYSFWMVFIGLVIMLLATLIRGL